ncbi:queuosine precursor transporter [Zavarzinia sp.]|uniref:queuosine precursor transporter n=1 Tax=Zavarzinia sp. TaxID=2027920 RepID=UPI0035695B19
MAVLAKADRGFFLGAVAAMTSVVVASNILVQYPFEPFGLADWLTWGAFSYPLSFFVTDLTNRQVGPQAARRVVYAGFLVAVVLSALLSEPRIAAASGLAFLVGQLLDVTVFNRLRRQSWWRAPFVASALGSLVDTAVFFTAAFAGSGLPWTGWAAGDLAVKMTFALGLLAPFRLFMAWYRRPAMA